MVRVESPAEPSMRTTLWSLELRPDEGHHVGARDPHRRLVHDGEEHLQVEGHGQARVGPRSSGQELQVLVGQRVTNGHLQLPSWITERETLGTQRTATSFRTCLKAPS